MKGEKFVSMLNNHALVINNQGRMLDRHQAALAYQATRAKAQEQVLTAGRFSMLQVALREVMFPGSFKKAVDAAQKALLAPQEPPKPAKAPEAKLDIKPAPGATEA